MHIEITGRNPSGTCDLTGKSDVETWSLRAGNGETQCVSTQRLPEVLRVLSRVGTGTPPASPSKRSPTE
ncbi:MAG: hypothetical protein R3C18_16005 [Planctomycetaceae bacterium]